MSTVSILIASLLLVLGVILACMGYMALRAAILAGKPSSFGAWIISPESDQWIRGIALYGQTTLAWYRLSSASTRPTVELPRRRLDVIGGPVPSRDANYTVVKLGSPAGVYQLALLPGDAAGLISWVNSSPPGIQAH